MGSTELANRANWQTNANEDGKLNELNHSSFIAKYLKDFYGDKYFVKTGVRILYSNDRNYLVLDQEIVNNENGLSIFIETKRQNYAGNAHERAYKFTPNGGIAKYIRNKFNLHYHPVLFIFSGKMITDGDKYVNEINTMFCDCKEIVLLDKNEINDKIRFIEEQILPRINGIKSD
jgi:hypothetical protein